MPRSSVADSAAEPKPPECDAKHQARQRAEHRQFVSANGRGDLVAKVEIARDVLRRQLLEASGFDFIEDTLEMSAMLAGVERDSAEQGTGRITLEWEAYCDIVAAAFALGIATGQFFSPDLFAPKGGAR